MKFVIASHNKHKIEEFSRILLPLGIEVITADISDVEENGKTFMENSLLKSSSACKETSFPSIADDSGLCIDALNGEPGIYSARYAKEGERKATVLEKLKNENNRKAHFVCAISCVFPNGDIIKTEEICSGEISRELMGDNGFGYDPIFMVADKSFAQMSNDEKDKISHRGKALRAFRDKLSLYLKNGENNVNK